MNDADRPRATRPCRRLLVPFSAMLMIGCVLIDVDESRFGSPAALHFSAEHAPYASRDVIFSHSLHSFVNCATCHKESTSGPSPAAQGVELPSMALCFQCHDGKKLSNDCITCHISNRKDKKPGFHDGVFPRHHKHMAEMESYKCGLCHIQNECKDCHMERKPLSHTVRFERSTHGRMATHERRTCSTCHETAFCENCHSQPPPDHTDVFMHSGGHRQAALIRGRSCLTCHRFQDVCSQCHR